MRKLNTDFTLYNYLFGSTNRTKNTDSDKYKYSSYGKNFGSRSKISFTDGKMGKYAIIFKAGVSSSEPINNKNEVISILGEGLTQTIRWYHINSRS